MPHPHDLCPHGAHDNCMFCHAEIEKKAQQVQGATPPKPFWTVVPHLTSPGCWRVALSATPSHDCCLDFLLYAEAQAAADRMNIVHAQKTPKTEPVAPPGGVADSSVPGVHPLSPEVMIKQRNETIQAQERTHLADQAHIFSLEQKMKAQRSDLDAYDVKIVELDADVARLKRHLAEAREISRIALEERDMWKANHDNQVAIKRAVLTRPDLGDRAKCVADPIDDLKMYKKLQAEWIQGTDWVQEVFTASTHGDALFGMLGQHRALVIKVYVDSLLKKLAEAEKAMELQDETIRDATMALIEAGMPKVLVTAIPVAGGVRNMAHKFKALKAFYDCFRVKERRPGGPNALYVKLGCDDLTKPAWLTAQTVLADEIPKEEQQPQAEKNS